jgi:hypothetical protein
MDATERVLALASVVGASAVGQEVGEEVTSCSKSNRSATLLLHGDPLVSGSPIIQLCSTASRFLPFICTAFFNFISACRPTCGRGQLQ